jgi:methylated-DNA-[protein]-cysteine S-methyltransferase
MNRSSRRGSSETAAAASAGACLFTEIDTALGAIRLAAEAGAIVRVELPPLAPAPPAWVRDDDDRLLRAAARQLQEYFAGRRTAFDLPLRFEGTPFQKRAWQALCAIPFGQTRSYGQQARAIAQPTAVRAVGGANARNPIAIIVPCHRVIGSDGNLTGYGGGMPAKRWLLAHERAHADGA